MQTEPTPAERARTIVASAAEAALATMTLDLPGTPFASLVALATDHAGRPILCLSSLAEHAKNLWENPRASVLAVEPHEPGDGLAKGRVTLLGSCEQVAASERDTARSCFLAAQHGALYADFADFAFYRLDVEEVRWVGGFGAMTWVKAADYAAAEPDPLAGELAASAVEHMNTDHADAVLLMAHAQGGCADAASAEVVRIDRYGFSAVAASEPRPVGFRVPFAEPVTDADSLRAAMVQLTRTARNAQVPT